MGNNPNKGEGIQNKKQKIKNLGEPVKTNEIGLRSGVFANGLGDLVSIPGRVIPKSFKMVLGVVAIENRAFWSPSTTVANFTYLML